MKLFAVVAMLVDHTACVFGDRFPTTIAGDLYYWMRVFGRLAMPIFAYYAAVGATHTTAPKKYLLRLLIFAVVAEIPFYLAFREHGNVIATMFLGVLACLTIRGACGKAVPQKIFAALVGLACIYIAMEVGTDYGWYGVTMILGFYICGRGHLLACIVQCMIAALYYSRGGSPIQMYSLLALPLIVFFDEYGDKLPSIRLGRYFFYIFYPTHLAVLWLIYQII